MSRSATCPDLAYNELKPGEQADATSRLGGDDGGRLACSGRRLRGRSRPSRSSGVTSRTRLANFEAAAPVKPITARIVVTVGDHPAVPSASDAMDAVLGDAAFTAWLTEHRRGVGSPSQSAGSTGAWVVQIRSPRAGCCPRGAIRATGAGIACSEGPRRTPGPDGSSRE
mgnify:CR=1 FL=1